ncbi:MlaD family protein [Pseudonocardia spinosispora]|uniref:MlaD family protein n=1 Tax=Pseudonocardia spinosispora TaxID=103441 RepID=UPI0012EC02F1|nr:MlaD family protein [Pseudonocardia spinosispora]
MRTSELLLRRPALTGLVLIGVAAVIAVLLFQRSAIVTALEPGETLTVQLARDYKVAPYGTAVKIAGTKVGVVQSVDSDTGGPVEMTLKLDHGTRALLGTEPRVVIRPATVLGGSYYVQLYPGGAPGTSATDVVPVQRTSLPVELDELLSAIPPDAQHGLQGMTERLDSTLKAGAGNDLNQLLADAPAALRPTGEVADALRGLNKDTDLATMVTNLDRTAKVLSESPGQLGSIADSLANVSKTFGTNASPVDRTITTMPETLRATRTGADDLAVTLDKVTDTADDARPTVKELDPLLHDLRPAIADLRPVVADLRPLLEDAEPLVRQLEPTVGTATDVLDDLKGPVLDRVNGPILGSLNTEWHGLAPKYPNGGGDGQKFYQEIGYTFAHLADSVRYYDATSHLLGFQVGAGSTSVEGTGITAQQLQDYLSEFPGKPGSHGPPLKVGPELKNGVPLPDPGIKPPVLDLDKGPVR